jgi:hypothetical protein
MFGKRAEQEQIAALRAEVQSLQARLSADVSTLDPGDDPMSRQALADAGERQTAAGSLLATATTLGELRVAHRIAVEGLTATRLVRERRGLPLGPDLPDLAMPTVNSPTTINVDGVPQVAHPEYHPERPHFFGGNNMAPAGYYRTPFWKKAFSAHPLPDGGSHRAPARPDPPPRRSRHTHSPSRPRRARRHHRRTGGGDSAPLRSTPGSPTVIIRHGRQVMTRAAARSAPRPPRATERLSAADDGQCLHGPAPQRCRPRGRSLHGEAPAVTATPKNSAIDDK